MDEPRAVGRILATVALALSVVAALALTLTQVANPLHLSAEMVRNSGIIGGALLGFLPFLLPLLARRRRRASVNAANAQTLNWDLSDDNVSASATPDAAKLLGELSSGRASGVHVVSVDPTEELHTARSLLESAAHSGYLVVRTTLDELDAVRGQPEGLVIRRLRLARKTRFHIPRLFRLSVVVDSRFLSPGEASRCLQVLQDAHRSWPTSVFFLVGNATLSGGGIASSWLRDRLWVLGPRRQALRLGARTAALAIVAAAAAYGTLAIGSRLLGRDVLPGTHESWLIGVPNLGLAIFSYIVAALFLELLPVDLTPRAALGWIVLPSAAIGFYVGGEFLASLGVMLSVLAGLTWVRSRTFRSWMPASPLEVGLVCVVFAIVLAKSGDVLDSALTDAILFESRNALNTPDVDLASAAAWLPAVVVVLLLSRSQVGRWAWIGGTAGVAMVVASTVNAYGLEALPRPVGLIDDATYFAVLASGAALLFACAGMSLSGAVLRTALTTALVSQGVLALTRIYELNFWVVAFRWARDPYGVMVDLTDSTAAMHQVVVLLLVVPLVIRLIRTRTAIEGHSAVALILTSWLVTRGMGWLPTVVLGICVGVRLAIHGTDLARTTVVLWKAVTTAIWVLGFLVLLQLSNIAGATIAKKFNGGSVDPEPMRFEGLGVLTSAPLLPRLLVTVLLVLVIGHLVTRSSPLSEWARPRDGWSPALLLASAVLPASIFVAYRYGSIGGLAWSLLGAGALTALMVILKWRYGPVSPLPPLLILMSIPLSGALFIWLGTMMWILGGPVHAFDRVVRRPTRTAAGLALAVVIINGLISQSLGWGEFSDGALLSVVLVPAVVLVDSASERSVVWSVRRQRLNDLRRLVYGYCVIALGLLFWGLPLATATFDEDDLSLTVTMESLLLAWLLGLAVTAFLLLVANGWMTGGTYALPRPSRVTADSLPGDSRFARRVRSLWPV